MRAKLEGQKHTIVTPHKRIAVASPHLAVDELARALERDVHVAVDGLELACLTTKENTLLAELCWAVRSSFQSSALDSTYPCKPRQS